MKRKLLTSLFALTLLLVFAGCAPHNDAGGSKTDSGTASTDSVTTNQDASNFGSDRSVSSVQNASTPSGDATGSTASNTAGNNSQNDAKLSREQAENIAFAHAGVAKTEVRDLEVELDRDDGVLSYEIEFKSGGNEYEYDIHAVTGEILKSEEDGKSISQRGENITADSAKSIAFTHAGVTAADVRDLEVEFDRDDGVPSYEIEFKSGGNEYEYDIHAVSGDILKSEKDRND